MRLFSLNLHCDCKCEAILQQLVEGQKQLLERVKAMALNIDDVVAKATAQTTVVDSIDSLLTSVKAELDAISASGGG